MRLTVWVCGREVFTVSLGDDPVDNQEQVEGGDNVTSYPVGFTASLGDQRWNEHTTPELE